MSDVELRLTANVDEATRGIGRFRKEYRDLVQQVEKPLRQVNTFRDLETSLENTSREMRTARERVRELATALASAANPSREMQAGYREAVRELQKLERSEGALTGQIARRRNELQAAGLDTRNLAAEQRRLADELSRALEAGRGDMAMQGARSALGVGSIEATQRDLLTLREQYRLLTRDGNLSAKERAEAEATYRRSVSETLERLRHLREATRQNATASEQEATAAARRHAAAALGIRQVTAEQRQAAIAARQAALDQARNDLGVNRYRALRVEVGQVRDQYELLRRSGNLTTRELALAQRNMTQRVRETQRALREMNAEQRRSGVGMAGMAGLSGMLAPAAIGYGSIRALRGIAAISDEWVELTDRMKIATNTQQEYEQGLERLRAISDRTYTSMSNNAEVFINALSPMRERGFTDNETLQFVEAIGLGLVASAAKGERATSVINQLNAALQQGELRGDAFNSVITNTPAIADALTRGLGKTREQLSAMAKAGELTTDVWVPALLSQTDSLGVAVDGMAVTVGDALQRLDNAWTQTIGEADMTPLISAIEQLTAVVSDPAVMEGLLALASGLVKVAETSIQSASDFAHVGKTLGYSAALISGQVTELDKLEKQINDVDRAMRNAGDTPKAGFGVITPSKGQLQAMRADLVDQRNAIIEHLTGVTEEQRQAEEERSQIEEEAHQASVDRHRKYVSDLGSIQDTQLGNIKAFLQKQKAEEAKAVREIERIREERLKIDERYDDALNKLARGNRPSNFLDATYLRSQAQQALNAGDIESARRLARQALDVLMELQEAGENTYGFEGVINSLRGIEHAASDLEQTQAETKLAGIRQSMEEVKKAAEALEDMPVSMTLDEQQMEAVRAQIKALAAAMKKELVLPVQVAAPAGEGSSGAGPIPGFATGGPIRGPGTGTSDSILLWGSNGEFMMRERAVRHYGLEFMNKLNQGRIPRFATGGAIADIPRHVPFIPPMPAAAEAVGAAGSTLNLSMDGQTYQFQGTDDTIAALARAVRTRKLQRR